MTNESNKSSDPTDGLTRRGLLVFIAVGYGALTLLFIAFDAWRWAAGAYDGGDIASGSISVVLLLGLTALSILAGRRASTRNAA